MATISYVLSDYKKKNGKQAIRMRITHKNVQYEATGFEILENQWDQKKERVKTNHDNHKGINNALDALYKKVETAYSDAVTMGNKVTATELKEVAFATHNFYEHIQTVIDKLDPIKNYRTKKKYVSLLHSLQAFKPSLDIEDITPQFLQKYRSWLETKTKDRKGLAHNTVTSRLATMRTIYKLSAYKPIKNPFDEFKVGSFRASNKEPLTIHEIALIWNYEPRNNSERLAKDTFLFSFYSAGMRSEDVLTLKWSEITDMYIKYDQAKKKHLSKDTLAIPLNSFLEEILSRYDRSTKTVFNQIHETGVIEQKDEIAGQQVNINNYLKKIAQRVGITKEISFKLARNTFADVANKKSNRDIYGIQKSLGHSKISTTEIYLGNDQTAIDDLLKQVYGN